MKYFNLVNNALVMPLEGTMDAFNAGVFAKGQCLEGSLLNRAIAALPKEPQNYLQGTYIFGGHLFGHHGHFLLESLSRLYAIKNCRNCPILFVSPNDFIAQIQKNILKFLNVENELILIKAPTQVESLIISPAGSSILPDFILPEQLAALGQIGMSTKAENRKIWLSRSAISGGGVENEKDIENSLASLGWEIIHPQILPITTQVRFISSARYVAGFDGSAFFTSLLANKVHGKFIVFGRRNFIASTIIYMLGQRGFDLQTHVFPVQPLDGEKALKRFMFNDPNLLLDVIKTL